MIKTQYTEVERDLQLQVAQLVSINNIMVDMLNGIVINDRKIFKKEDFLSRVQEHIEKTYKLKGKAIITRYDD